MSYAASVSSPDGGRSFFMKCIAVFFGGVPSANRLEELPNFA
jgi:hypothetical protein